MRAGETSGCLTVTGQHSAPPGEQTLGADFESKDTCEIMVAGQLT